MSRVTSFLSREHYPQNKQYSAPSEQLRKKPIFWILISIRVELSEVPEIGRIVGIIHVVVSGVVIVIVVSRVREPGTPERSCQEAERESSDTKRQSEPLSEPQPAPVGLPLRSWSLSLRSGWCLTPWVLPAPASPVNRNNVLLTDPSFTNRTQRALSPHLIVADLQPPVETGPAEEVTTETDHGVPRRVQTDVTFEVVGCFGRWGPRPAGLSF